MKDVPANAFDGLKQLGVDGEKMKEQLEKMNTVAVTLNLGKEVKFSAVMGMKDADAADEFGGSLDKLGEKMKSFLPFLAGRSAASTSSPERARAAVRRRAAARSANFPALAGAHSNS